MKGSASVLLYVKQSRNVTGHTKGNVDLPNPPVAVAVVDGHIDELDDAEQAVHSGKGTVAERDTKLGVVQSDMGLYLAYAEAEANANPEKGAAIIEGGGFYVVKRKNPGKADLAARYTKTPGALKLAAKAKKRPASYYWQMCVNPTSPNPATWSDLPETHQASTTVEGLTPGMTYAFRYRTLTRDGTSDWSSPILIMAH
jgi:hypothetical protein